RTPANRLDFAQLTSKKDLDARRPPRDFPPPAQPIRAVSPGTGRTWHTRNNFVVTGLRRITSLGSPRTPSDADPRPRWLAGSAAGSDRSRSPPGSKGSLPRVLSGRPGHRESWPLVRAARHRRL